MIKNLRIEKLSYHLLAGWTLIFIIIIRVTNSTTGAVASVVKRSASAALAADF